MSTQSLLDFLEADLPSGWSRSSGSRSLLSLIQKAQDLLFKSLGRKRRYIGSDNKGFEPYLKTVAGTYSYDIIAANLSCGALVQNLGGTDYPVTADILSGIFVDASCGDYGLAYLGEPILYGEINPFYVGNERVLVRRIPVDSMPGLENTPPRLNFKSDPGTNDKLYFCGFLWLPPRLTSELVPLMIPEDFEDAIEDYVRSKLQTSENGAKSDFADRFLGFWIPRFKNEYRRGANVLPKYTEPLYW